MFNSTFLFAPDVSINPTYLNLGCVYIHLFHSQMCLHPIFFVLVSDTRPITFHLAILTHSVYHKRNGPWWQLNSVCVAFVLAVCFNIAVSEASLKREAFMVTELTWGLLNQKIISRCCQSEQVFFLAHLTCLLMLISSL